MVDGKLDVLMLDCTPFPAADRPVLDEVSVEISGEQKRISLLFIEGFAADGVSEIRLLNNTGQTLGTSPVVNNTFSLSDSIAGTPASAVKIVAVDSDGHDVWEHALGPAATR